MSENATNTPPVVTAAPAAEDLSKELEHAIGRAADERIRIVRVFDDCYRCNWWVRDKTPTPDWMNGGTIRRSQFVRATRTAAGLVIENVK